MRKWFMQKLFNRIWVGSLTVAWWDGEVERFGDGPPAVRLLFRRPISLGRFLLDPVLAFGEAYMDGDVEVEGELEELVRLAHLNRQALPGVLNGRIWEAVFALRGRLASAFRQKRDVQHHYDLGNDFFSLWLDETMSYSCAYFRSPEDSLTQAQLQKIDHVLAKLAVSVRGRGFWT